MPYDMEERLRFLVAKHGDEIAKRYKPVPKQFGTFCLECSLWRGCYLHECVGDDEIVYASSAPSLHEQELRHIWESNSLI